MDFLNKAKEKVQELDEKHDLKAKVPEAIGKLLDLPSYSLLTDACFKKKSKSWMKNIKFQKRYDGR